MNEWPALDRFLRTDPRDVGCAKAMELLHVYVELVAARCYPGVEAHLQACGPCGQDFDGLLAAVHGLGERQPPRRPARSCSQKAARRGRRLGGGRGVHRQALCHAGSLAARTSIGLMSGGEASSSSARCIKAAAIGPSR